MTATAQATPTALERARHALKVVVDVSEQLDGADPAMAAVVEQQAAGIQRIYLEMAGAAALVAVAEGLERLVALGELLRPLLAEALEEDVRR